MAEIQLTFEDDGSVTQSTIDLLEDFWFDFQSFHRKAQAAGRVGDVLKVHRYLRASVSSLVGYLAGLANRWRTEAIESGKLEPSLMSGGSPPAGLSEGLADLSRRLGQTPPPAEALEFLISLVSRCADLQPADESDLFHALSLEKVEEAERHVLAWLDEFRRGANLPGHSDTRAIGLPFAEGLGEVTRESYHDYDEIAHESYPLPDALKARGEASGRAASGQAEG